MKTEILVPNKKNLKKCADWLKWGEVVAFPTETVYGLGAGIFFDNAVKKIFKIKGRPCDNPLIVHIGSLDQICDLVSEIPKLAYNLFDLMPGPLTILFKKNKVISDLITAGRDTVGIRFPAHKTARDLITLCGFPLCAPSANTSTRPSPTKAEHVFEDISGKIKYILDGGDCNVGVESTIIDLSQEAPRILRQGGISLEELKERLGDVSVTENFKEALCPGMKYKHYSPTAEVYFAHKDDNMQKKIGEKYIYFKGLDIKVLILCMSPNAYNYSGYDFMDIGETSEDYARNLFAAFREADKKGYNVILCEGVSQAGIGAAVMNRIKKASGGKML